MIDVTDSIMDCMDSIAKHYGKESGRDLTKEDIDKFIEEYWKPFVNESWHRIINWTDEDTKELEKYNSSLFDINNKE